MTERLHADIRRAADILRRGGLVAVPTETVYGLCGNGLDAAAVERIYEVKGRPAIKPLSLMVAGPEELGRWCREVPEAAHALAERFWPGPLTLVLPARTELVPDIVRAGGMSVGLRCPDHPVTLELLRQGASPLAGPSANPSGMPAPRSAEEVLAFFDGRIDAVLDGGTCAVGLESTILDMSRTPYRILRQGALPEEELRAALRDTLCVIGLTGGSGCGKTAALEVLRERGACILDCDAVYHRLTREDRALQEALRARFGEDIVRGGELDRKKLGGIVFGDAAALRELNDITHSFVKREVDRLLSDHAMRGGTLAAIDAIALLESGLGEYCRAVVGVTADTETRVRRITARDGIPEEYARRRIAAQRPNEYFERHCTHTLRNDSSDINAFRRDCRELFDQILGGQNMETKEKKEPSRRDDLFYQPKNGYDRIDGEERLALESYCRDYMAYLDVSRTEREAVAEAIRQAEEKGFRRFVPGMELQPGTKVYHSVRGKALLLAVIGRRPFAEGINIAAAHVDSPRLDLKQLPLYEDSELCYFKTHYYGGIKKYQWVTIPLELHGVVTLKSGENVEIVIGREPGDPQFVITDLLPHLGADQMKKTASQVITGEGLNLLIGSVPYADDGSDRVKLAVISLLNERYGITEEDFLSAELEAVPAHPVREIGLDRSLIGGYGHDDRVCAYAELRALFDLDAPERTAVCILADKEEIGSEGVSGMQSQAFEAFLLELSAAEGTPLHRCLDNSFCVSADVCNAFDPNFPEVSEKRNAARINYGMGICKFTGSRGKSGTNDASAETVGTLRRIFEKHGVLWQMAELGKVDQGGGGTVAMYMSRRGIDTIDAGVPVLSMHAPFEIVAKLDCYMTYKGVRAFYADR